MSTEIAKQEAIAKACHIFREERNEFTELYASVDVMEVNQIKDYFGELIFKHLPEDISGRLFFFDPVPFANWGHPCQYLLIIDDAWVERVDYQRGVADTIQLEKVY